MPFGLFAFEELGMDILWVRDQPGNKQDADEIKYSFHGGNLKMVINISGNLCDLKLYQVGRRDVK